MNAPAPVLDIRGLTISLPAGADRDNAVEDIDLQVHPKEIVCVVGESGSGKSVTAHAVMGLLPKGELQPTAGAIHLAGKALLEKTPAELRELRGARMSMIFQEPFTALNPVVRVGQQIEEVLTIHTDMSASARRTRVLAVMDDVRLPEPEQMIDAFPHQLSGGQRQRIMIAAALALEPALLIADEPTTALDVTTQAQILALIKDIQASHDTGVLFITHDFGVVAEIADRVIVMQNGRVVEAGAASRVLTTPEHPYTQMLIASVPSLIPKVRDGETHHQMVLATRDLAKTYKSSGLFQKTREVQAASNVNISLQRGETLGIVGESGSGKSTVARCIVRLITPTSGAIMIHDQDIAPLRASKLQDYRQKVQIVFQDPYRSLNPRRTVGLSIVEGPMNFGLDQATAWTRARELMSLVGLDPNALDRLPHQFSGGQRQRICIARALAMQPEILIADEAVSALDVSVQAQVLKLLDQIREQFNLAMLFITHDLRVAAQVCDRIVVMHRGEVVEQGSASTVFSSPAHAYTKALFEAAPGREWSQRLHS
ncbi:MAG: ABC transporter ATP-binding protein [Alphaproteobacteria bacterium]|nr:ABC transporter ATP-binding protein [Alphaproteobacteria bacterium]